jgi:hypothetical protein
MALNNDASHDDRIFDALTCRSLPAEDHMLACASCRLERQRLQHELNAFSESVRSSTNEAGAFWTRQAAHIHARVSAEPSRQSWLLSRLVPVFAVLALFAILLLQNSPSPRPVTHNAPSRSDHDLLVEVERALDRQTPAALEPITLLVEDMSRSNNDPSANLHKEQPNHVN